MSGTRRFAVKLRAPDGGHWREFFCEAEDAEDARELAEAREREFVAAQAQAIVDAQTASSDEQRLAVLRRAGLPSDPGHAFDDQVGVRKYLRDNLYQVESVTEDG